MYIHEREREREGERERERRIQTVRQVAQAPVPPCRHCRYLVRACLQSLRPLPADSPSCLSMHRFILSLPPRRPPHRPYRHTLSAREAFRLAATSAGEALRALSPAVLPCGPSRLGSWSSHPFSTQIKNSAGSSRPHGLVYGPVLCRYRLSPSRAASSAAGLASPAWCTASSAARPLCGAGASEAPLRLASSRLG